MSIDTRFFLRNLSFFRAFFYWWSLIQLFVVLHTLLRWLIVELYFQDQYMWRKFSCCLLPPIMSLQRFILLTSSSQWISLVTDFHTVKFLFYLKCCKVIQFCFTYMCIGLILFYEILTVVENNLYHTFLQQYGVPKRQTLASNQ